VISDVAVRHFDQVWSQFDSILRQGGEWLVIDPLRHYFPTRFADRLTVAKAKRMLHEQLLKLGKIQQGEHEVVTLYHARLDDKTEIPFTRFKDPEVEWASTFVRTAFYNLCCLAAHGKTIEELIFEANKYRLGYDTGDGQSEYVQKQIDLMLQRRKRALRPIGRLISISNSSLLAKWMQDIITTAISNNDKQFFKVLSLSLSRDATTERFDTARTWLGRMLLSTRSGSRAGK
jgi:hypothetical protein